MSSVSNLHSPGYPVPEEPDQNASTSASYSSQQGQQVPTDGPPAHPHGSESTERAESLAALLNQSHPDEDLPGYDADAPEGRNPHLAPGYHRETVAGHTSSNPEASASALPPTSSPGVMRRMASHFTLRSNASTTTLGRTGNQGGGNIPPVPPLPASVRQGVVAGPGSAGTAVSPRKQIERNHRLRDAAAKGNKKDILRRLGKGADPTAPSSKAEQNSFHKIATAPNVDGAVVTEMLAKSGSLGLRQAAIKQDKDGNTPVHLLQYKLGFNSHDTNAQNQSEHLTRLSNALTQAALEGQVDVNTVRNNQGKTPAEMSEQGQIDGQPLNLLATNIREMGL